MSYTLPAGTYVIGDGCYNLRGPRWDEFLETSDSSSQIGYVTLDSGERINIVSFQLAADGEYSDHQGREYPIDSASIAIIPIKALEGEEPEEGTHKIVFKHEFECYDSHGTVVFGHIEINPASDSEDYNGDFDSEF